MFSLVVADENGKHHDIGSVKIGQVGLLPSRQISLGERTPDLPMRFDALDGRFFSLGQGEDYYAALNQLDPALKRRVLIGLRDCAFDLSIFETNVNETVMRESLLRDVYEMNVRYRLSRLSRGNAQLTKFQFRYTLPQSAGMPPGVMEFVVTPESYPPTNVHVLIGRNGVGKTRCMRQLMDSLLGRRPLDGALQGTIELLSDGKDRWSFAGLVLISFSAFDSFDLSTQASDLVGSQHVGLRSREADEGASQERIMSPGELARVFRISLERCRTGLKAERWRAAVGALATDDLFAEANVIALLDHPQDADWESTAEGLFRRLSSGHAIVLLTVTRLVELVDEKTLVLIDEPEAHLHPPLLAAFVRCLSDLLVKRNGVAIIATHSPVVLQEIPRSCAWKLRRSGAVSIVERPSIETFGENIGLLTREVFGLEVTRSGFHEMLRSAVALNLSYEQVVAKFDGQLGAEARAIAQALIAERDEVG